MRQSEQFIGLGVALVTPFLADGAIDYKSLERLLEHIITNGADYLIVHGTTGESPCLTRDERNEVTRKVVEQVAGRVPIVIGLGGNDTLEVGKRFRELDTTGIAGILSVAPYYNKPNQEGLYQHFAHIAKCTDLPIMLYNVPGRVVVNIMPETVIRLANDCPNIVAIKEASGFWEQGRQVAEAMQGKDFVVLSGDDALSMHFIRNGAKGVVSVAGNAYPQLCAKLIHLGIEGKLNEADLIQDRLVKLNSLLFANGNPSGIKALLKDMEVIDHNVLRLPLLPASKDVEQSLCEERLALDTYLRLEHPDLIK